MEEIDLAIGWIQNGKMLGIRQSKGAADAETRVRATGMVN